MCPCKASDLKFKLFTGQWYHSLQVFLISKNRIPFFLIVSSCKSEIKFWFSYLLYIHTYTIHTTHPKELYICACINNQESSLIQHTNWNKIN